VQFAEYLNNKDCW